MYPPTFGIPDIYYVFIVCCSVRCRSQKVTSTTVELRVIMRHARRAWCRLALRNVEAFRLEETATRLSG